MTLPRFVRRAVLLFVAATGGATAVPIWADDAAPPASQVPQVTSDLRDKQLDVALEAREIERLLTKIKRASQLAKDRMTEAAAAAEAVSSELDQNSVEAAARESARTAEMFEEVTRQLAALLMEEAPQRVAAARQQAAELSRLERQLADKLKDAQSENQGGSGGRVRQSEDPEAKGASTMEAPKPRTAEANTSALGGRGEQAPTPEVGTMPETEEGATTTEAGSAPETPKTPSGSGEAATSESTTTDAVPPVGQGATSPQPDAERPDPTSQASGAGSDPAKPTDEENGAATDPETLAEDSARLIERGQTLLDLLQSIAGSNDPADATAAGAVSTMLKETDLAGAVTAMQEAANQVRSGQLADAELTSRELADRMMIAAQRLERVYLTIVSPKAEELRELEQQMAMLREQLEEIRTPRQIGAWQREMRELIERAQEISLGSPEVSELLDKMLSLLAAGGALDQSKWSLVDGRYTAPEQFTALMQQVQEQVQFELQRLLLGDFASPLDEATPLKFRDFVDRYYEVLSQESASPGAARSPAPASK